MWSRIRPLESHCAPKQQAGFSLVELMVALVLGLLIVLAVSSVYVGHRVSSTLGKQTSLLQEEGSRAIDAMARDLRQAGDFNCVPASGVQGATLVNTGTTLPATPGIRGFSTFSEINTSALTGAAAIKTALDFTGNNANQVLAVSGTLESQSAMIAAANGTATSVQVNHQDFAANQTIVISDCVNASVLRASAYTKNNGAATGTLTFTSKIGGTASAPASYSASTSVARIATIWWFYGAPTFNGTAWPKGLYRVDGDIADASNGSGFKLIATRLENIAFTFDRDTSNPVDGVIDDRLIAPAAVGTTNAKWLEVRRARVELLLKSDSEVFPDKQAYYFNAASTQATDKRIYLPLELTTTLRNMYP